MHCSACGRAMAPADRFCPSCGAAAAPRAEMASPEMMAAPRAWVIVFGVLLSLTCLGMVIGIPLIVTECKRRPAAHPAGNTGWLIAGGIYAALFLMIASAGRNKKTTAPSSRPAATAQRAYGVGETAALKDHTLTVRDVTVDFTPAASYVKPEHSDNIFVVVRVRLDNTSGRKLPINDLGFKLEDESGVLRGYKYIGELDDRLESVTLAPGGHLEGRLAFEAKRDSRTLKLHYAGNFASGGEVVVKLK